MTLAMVCSLPAYGEYSYQLLLPPDAETARLTGINHPELSSGGLPASSDLSTASNTT